MRKNFILMLSLIAIIAILSSCSNEKNTEHLTTEEGIQDVLFEDEMYGQPWKRLFNFF